MPTQHVFNECYVTNHKRLTKQLMIKYIGNSKISYENNRNIKDQGDRAYTVTCVLCNSAIWLVGNTNTLIVLKSLNSTISNTKQKQLHVHSIRISFL